MSSSLHPKHHHLKQDLELELGQRVEPLQLPQLEQHCEQRQ